jgi:Uma2 family endonuclease
MVSQLFSTEAATPSDIIYPDSDGQPMSDNTKQFRWIVVIKENLESLFANAPDVFVAGDLLWYPIEGNNKIRTAPNAMVDGLPPQVVFEILSPGNTQTEMEKKLLFYDRYGVNEYYIYDPDRNQLRGWLRGEAGLDAIADMENWVSPQLQIRFNPADPELEIYAPTGQRFLTYTETAQQLEQERQRAEQERQRAEQERQRAEQAEQSKRDAIPRLLSMGLTPEQIAEALGLTVDEVTEARLRAEG